MDAPYSRVVLTTSGLVGRCGPVRQTILHEILHNVGKDHDVVLNRNDKGEPADVPPAGKFIRILSEYDFFEIESGLDLVGRQEVLEAKKLRQEQDRKEIQYDGE